MFVSIKDRENIIDRAYGKRGKCKENENSIDSERNFENCATQKGENCLHNFSLPKHNERKYTRRKYRGKILTSLCKWMELVV